MNRSGTALAERLALADALPGLGRPDSADPGAGRAFQPLEVAALAGDGQADDRAR